MTWEELNQSLQRYIGNADYIMLVSYERTERVVLADGNGMRTSEQYYSGIRAVCEHNGRVGYAVADTEADLEHLVAVAGRCAAFGGQAVLPRIRRMAGTHLRVEMPEATQDIEQAREILGRLQESGLPKARVRIRRALSTRIHADTLGSHVIERSYDPVITLNGYDHAGLLTSQFTDEEINGDNRVEAFLERAHRLSNAPIWQGTCREFVFGPRAAAGFIHEAIGHSLEADLFAEISKVREGICFPEELDVWDDPLAGGMRSGYQIDEDGLQAQAVRLIANGRIDGLLHSAGTAAAYAELPNGHGRSGRADVLPVPRQSTLQVRSVAGDAENFVSGMTDGVLLDGHVSGCWDGRKISLTVDGGQVIKRGRPVQAVRDVRITFDPFSALQAIRGIGDDAMVIDSYSCSKNGMRLPLRFQVPSLYMAFDSLNL